MNEKLEKTSPIGRPILGSVNSRIAACGRETDFMLALAELMWSSTNAWLIQADASMEPGIASGAVAFADTRSTTLTTGAAYIFGLSGQYYIRRLAAVTDAGMVWIADNPSFDPCLIRADETKVVGMVGPVLWSKFGFEVQDGKLIARPKAKSTEGGQ